MVRYLTCVAMFFIGILSVFGSEKDLIFYAKNCGEITLINYDENLVLNVDGDYTEFIKICISFVNISLLYIITLRMLGKSDEIFLSKLSLVNLKVRQDK